MAEMLFYRHLAVEQKKLKLSLFETSNCFSSGMILDIVADEAEFERVMRFN
jgi:hypothetical protein